jgi:hypothetical protein
MCIGLVDKYRPQMRESFFLNKWMYKKGLGNAHAVLCSTSL